MKNCDICNQPIKKNAIWCDTCGRKVSWGYKPAGAKLQEDSVEEPPKVESPEKTSVIEKEKTEEKRPSDITEESLIEKDSEEFDSRNSNNRVGFVIITTIIIGVALCIIPLIANSIRQSRDFLSESQTYEVGDTLTFGNYNGSPIEWRVLDVQDGRMLVITSEAICKRRYNKSFSDITWENCSLREWLNEDFFDEAFTSEEQGRIITTTVTADRNPNYSTNPGNDTEDRVFLLSIDEANRYFDSDSDRACQYNGSVCYWWLRSLGISSDYAALVNYYGSVYYFGYNVDTGIIGVRPALWINLES